MEIVLKAECRYVHTSSAKYYQVNFSSGISGYVAASILPGVITIADAMPTRMLAIVDMQQLLNKLEIQLRGLLAKIEQIKVSLTAAAALSQ